jgi:hypothetical protein
MTVKRKEAETILKLWIALRRRAQEKPSCEQFPAGAARISASFQPWRYGKRVGMGIF